MVKGNGVMIHIYNKIRFLRWNNWTPKSWEDNFYLRAFGARHLAIRLEFGGIACMILILHVLPARKNKSRALLVAR